LLSQLYEPSAVAGGQGQGGNLTQLSFPCGLFVDYLGAVYVTDSNSHRIIRRSEKSEGIHIIAEGYGPGNLYVVDFYNQRIQKFGIIAD
jgi:hypothetical protein